MATRFVPLAGVGNFIATGGLGANGIIALVAGAEALIGAEVGTGLGVGAAIGALG